MGNMSEAIDVAFTLINKEQYAEALEMLVQLIKDEPDNSKCYYLAGQCHRFLNRYPEAICMLKRSIELNDFDPHTFLALGIAQQLEEDYESSINSLREAISLDKHFVSAYNSLGLTYKNLGEFKKAIECYSRGIQCLVEDANSEIKMNQHGEKEELIIDGKKTYVVNPKNIMDIRKVLCSELRYSVCMNNIGVCLIELGDIKSAREHFFESIEFTPEGVHYPPPHENLKSIE